MEIAPDRPPHHERDYDGRPLVDDYHGYDPLLVALMREHPEKIPKELGSGPRTILATASD
jgi:hypothetical protein